MISAQEAAPQIERLSGLDRYPRGHDQTAAVRELRLAAQSAVTVEILRLVVDDWLATQRECPKPVDMKRLVGDRNKQYEASTARRVPDCPECGGVGFKIVERNGYSGAKPCVCRKPAAVTTGAGDGEQRQTPGPLQAAREVIGAAHA
jgi:hypothetical protein